MPKIYIINDPSPNAFATGRDPKHAIVCVTTGILEILDKSELEGVIAHELSHVKNFDIRLMGIVAVLVGFIKVGVVPTVTVMVPAFTGVVATVQ